VALLSAISPRYAPGLPLQSGLKAVGSWKMQKIYFRCADHLKSAGTKKVNRVH